MIPFLNDGDYVDIALGETTRSGNIIVFGSPAGHMIKFCVGTPGEPLSLDGNVLKVNDQEIELQNDAQVHCWTSWIGNNQTVPDNCYIVLGTTPGSVDSRAKGYILKENIIGNAVIWQVKSPHRKN